jgi:hypothetical protein
VATATLAAAVWLGYDTPAGTGRRWPEFADLDQLHGIRIKRRPRLNIEARGVVNVGGSGTTTNMLMERALPVSQDRRTPYPAETTKRQLHHPPNDGGIQVLPPTDEKKRIGLV